jgi:hypothetical protein
MMDGTDIAILILAAFGIWCVALGIVQTMATSRASRRK